MSTNAKIEDTHLGFEDHGIFTFILYVKYDQSLHQGIGMIALDHPHKDPNGKFIKRVGTKEGMQMIMDILEVIGVDRWENLKGKYIRVEHKEDGNSVQSFGHITEKRWFKFP